MFLCLFIRQTYMLQQLQPSIERLGWDDKGTHLEKYAILKFLYILSNKSPWLLDWKSAIKGLSNLSNLFLKLEHYALTIYTVAIYFFNVHHVENTGRETFIDVSIFYAIIIIFFFEDFWGQRFCRQPVIIQTKPLSPKSRPSFNSLWKEKRREQCLCFFYHFVCLFALTELF